MPLMTKQAPTPTPRHIRAGSLPEVDPDSTPIQGSATPIDRLEAWARAHGRPWTAFIHA